MWVSPKDHKIIGARLKAVRRRADVTQVELAKRLKKPQSFVSSYENGQRRVDLLELTQIANALRLPVREILDEILDGIVPHGLPPKTFKRGHKKPKPSSP